MHDMFPVFQGTTQIHLFARLDEIVARAVLHGFLHLFFHGVTGQRDDGYP